MQIYLQIIAGIWIIFLAIMFIPALTASVPAERRSSRYIGQSCILVIIVVILIIILSRFGAGALVFRLIPDSPLAGVAGVLFAITGLSFSLWARFHLGRYWSSMVMIKVGHQLIRTGPYRIVRNPIYSGILLAFAGAAVAIGELPAFIALLIGIASIWVKVKAEEEILLEKFGEEYRQYKREVKALIPFIV
jgi:protein-S-isoprenylcysteine O-methyltransferase Ste14